MNGINAGNMDIPYVQVDYVTIDGGCGTDRVLLTHLPTWLRHHPGTMIVRLTVL